MANELTGYEKRIKWLEDQVLALQAALASVKHMAGQAVEDANRQQQDDNAGRVLIRGQSVGVIAASSGANPGTGTFRVIQLVGGTRYLMQPFANGDLTGRLRQRHRLGHDQQRVPGPGDDRRRLDRAGRRLRDGRPDPGPRPPVMM